MGFETLIYALQNWGVMDIILPFILIFTIVFATIERAKILAKDEAKNKKYAVVVALVIAFAVITPHVTGAYYYGFDAVEIINSMLPQIGLVLVACVMMLLTVGLWLGDKMGVDKGPGKWFMWASMAIVIFIILNSLNWIDSPYWLRNLLTQDVIALVMAILVFGIVIKFIVSDGEDPVSKGDRIKTERENAKKREEAIRKAMEGN